MKRFFSNLKLFIKSKKGNFVSLCLIYPIWLLIILVMITEANNHQRLQQLIETNQVVSRIIENSESYEDAVDSVQIYISQLHSSESNLYVQYTSENHGVSYFHIDNVQVFDSSKNGGYTSSTNDIETITQKQGTWWKEKNSVTYSITIYTNAHLTQAFTFNVGIYSINLVDDHYTITTTVLLSK